LSLSTKNPKGQEKYCFDQKIRKTLVEKNPKDIPKFSENEKK
jgi:hypothetical protein